MQVWRTFFRGCLPVPRQWSSTRNTLQNEVFRSLHSLLTHASNVSRLFWPSPPRRRKGESADTYRSRIAGHCASARAAHLRAAVGLAEDHPLKSREIRDHLEHFDERLDDWAETSVGKSIVQDLIGGPNAIVGIADEDMMRWYDPATHSLRFRGSQYAIRTIVDGLAEVFDACTRVLASSGFGRSLKLIEWKPTPPVSAS